jgi:hypothetical protein
MCTNILTFPWEKGVYSHQVASNRMEQDRERKKCGLVIVECGLVIVECGLGLRMVRDGCVK